MRTVRIVTTAQRKQHSEAVSAARDKLARETGSNARVLESFASDSRDNFITIIGAE